jgi:hypothetical protein
MTGAIPSRWIKAAAAELSCFQGEEIEHRSIPRLYCFEVKSSNPSYLNHADKDNERKIIYHDYPFLAVRIFIGKATINGCRGMPCLLSPQRAIILEREAIGSRVLAKREATR